MMKQLPPLLSAGLGALLFGTSILPLSAAHVDGRVTLSGELKQWHAVTLNLAGPEAGESDIAPGTFTVAWFNPREGGALTPASVVGGGQPIKITAPSADEDWLAVVRRQRTC